jgi:hypothetical protein
MQNIEIKSSDKIKKTVEETITRFMSMSIHLGVPKFEQILSELCIKSMKLQNYRESSDSNFLLPSLTEQSKISRPHSLLP